MSKKIQSKYLRLSVVPHCNLSCYFCHNEGQPKEDPTILDADDIEWLAKVAINAGFRKFKLTGGEPTLRKDLPQIISNISSAGATDLSMITNGIRLETVIEDLRNAGLNRLNVSLMSVSEQYHKEYMGGNKVTLEKTIAGIDKALAIGYEDIKLNHILHNTTTSALENFEEVLSFANERELTTVLIPLLPYNLKSSDKVLSQAELYNVVKETIGIEEEKIIEDFEGLSYKTITTKKGKILLKSTDLNRVLPYSACGVCNVKNDCMEGIFPLRVSARGEVHPCLAGGVQSINVHSDIQGRNEGKVSEYLTKAY